MLGIVSYIPAMMSMTEAMSVTSTAQSPYTSATPDAYAPGTVAPALKHLVGAAMRGYLPWRNQTSRPFATVTKDFETNVKCGVAEKAYLCKTEYK